MKKLQIIIIAVLFILLILMSTLYFKNNNAHADSSAKTEASSVQIQESKVAVDTNLSQAEIDVGNAFIASFNSFMSDNSHPFSEIEKTIKLRKQFIEMTEGKHHTSAYISTKKDFLDVIPAYKQYCIGAMTYKLNDKVLDCYAHIEDIEGDNQYATTSREAVLENLVIELAKMKRFQESEKVAYYLLEDYSNNHDTYRNLQIVYVTETDGFIDGNERGCYMFFLLDRAKNLGNKHATASLDELPKIDCSNYNFDEILQRMSNRALNSKSDNTENSNKKIGFNK